MPENPDQPVRVVESAGVPTKCVACERQLNSPVVCDYCHTLNPLNAPADYFHLLGVERRFDLDQDELRRKYLALNRHAHPDFHTAEAPESQELSLQISSALNDAYRTLLAPISRAEYLVEVLGGKSSAQDKSVPDGFLGQVMAMREQVEEAQLSGDKRALEDLRETLDQHLAEMTQRLGELFSSFDTTVTCEATRLDDLGRIRRQLNAISYIRRLVSQINS